MAKKRTSLDAILAPALQSTEPEAPDATLVPDSPRVEGKRPTVKQQTAYLPTSVHEQLRRLAFEERHKMHDYLMEGLDLVFKSRGLPSIHELTGEPTKPDQE